MDTPAVLEEMGVRAEDLTNLKPGEVDWERVASEVPVDLSYESRLALALAITSQATAEGEYRVNGSDDIEGLFAVLDNSGVHWECTHLSPHRSSKVVGFEG